MKRTIHCLLSTVVLWGYMTALQAAAALHVEGTLSWKENTSYLSIPAAAFMPQNNYTDETYNAGSYIMTDTAGNGQSIVQAPVELPHGATITAMTVYWYDDYDANDGSIRLYRVVFGQVIPMPLAEIETVGNQVNGSETVNQISFPVIDNSKFGYFISATLPTNGTEFVGLYGVVIEYTTSGPH